MAALSLEALAMADVNHHSFDMDFEEWERREVDQLPPPHLLAGDEEGEVVVLNDEEGEENVDHDHQNMKMKKKKKKKKILHEPNQSRVVRSFDMERLLNVWVNKVLAHAGNYQAMNHERRDSCNLRSGEKNGFKDLSYQHFQIKRKSEPISEFRRFSY
ncbi:hypothetical protein PanWU01x14_242760 [Parasponia andersonii]|uniref:Uncharacterized protein n=1 Tax=Parasponia andersonii TaxID=3476 RepID=A0A2P5BFS7_PARAD|nr:hypothetical protein PanWU01x14_242760 [Parasponia andersonii]